MYYLSLGREVHLPSRINVQTLLIDEQSIRVTNNLGQQDEEVDNSAVNDDDDDESNTDHPKDNIDDDIYDEEHDCNGDEIPEDQDDGDDDCAADPEHDEGLADESTGLEALPIKEGRAIMELCHEKEEGTNKAGQPCL